MNVRGEGRYLKGLKRGKRGIKKGLVVWREKKSDEKIKGKDDKGMAEGKEVLTAQWCVAFWKNTSQTHKTCDSQKLSLKFENIK